MEKNIILISPYFKQKKYIQFVEKYNKKVLLFLQS